MMMMMSIAATHVATIQPIGDLRTIACGCGAVAACTAGAACTTVSAAAVTRQRRHGLLWKCHGFFVLLDFV